MKGDFSRLTWDRRKHYAAVLMQQGRLQVDADWNEQIDIIMHRLETEVSDYVGHSGVPGRSPGGFRVGLSTVDGADATRPTLVLGPGRIYVEGRLFENDEPFQVALSDLLPADLAEQDRARAVVYLDTWQRQVTFAEDPAIREVALGGPDTATRLQNAWRLRVAATSPDTEPATLVHPWQPALPQMSDGLMNARVNADAPALENQLYRVEIHSASDEGVRFTWSRDNGSVVATVTDVQPATRTLSLVGGGRDADAAVTERQWVELLTHEQALAGERGPIVQVERADERQVVITEPTWPWTAQDAPALRVLRRWDDPSGLVASTVVGHGDGGDGGWVPLESGIEVRFEAAADGARTYVAGDYWLIPARSVTASIEWASADAKGQPAAQPARGVRHRYAALALLDRDDKSAWSVAAGGDLRSLVSPLDDGFVSKGAAGDVMRGPLSVAPLLRASADGDDLVALRVAAVFDDADRQGVRHTALHVTGGDVTFGAEEQPISTTAHGYFNVLGPAYARELDIRTKATIGSRLTVSGYTGEGSEPPGWTVQVGNDANAFGLTAGADLDVGYLRFGDGSGQRFHIGRARRTPDAPLNTDSTTALLTVVDNGSVGIGTASPLPFTTLHIARQSGWGPLLAITGEFSLAPVARSMKQTAPPSTLVIAGQINSGEKRKVFFYWKDSDGELWGAALNQDDATTTQIRTAAAR